MNDTPCRTSVILPLASAILVFVAGCATDSPPPPASAQAQATFRRVLPLLETNCVHCHGDQRLPTMPALTDTKVLATLIGPGKLIVPGQPERSRFFQVVTLLDDQPGVMPPTGHAISKREIESLRAWIQSGAPLPAENVALRPRGPGPRSL